MKLGGLMNRTAIGCPIKVLQVSPVTFDTVSDLYSGSCLLDEFAFDAARHRYGGWDVVGLSVADKALVVRVLPDAATMPRNLPALTEYLANGCLRGTHIPPVSGEACSSNPEGPARPHTKAPSPIP